MSSKFLIRVNTGDLKDAGTDARISITLTDKSGKSCEPHLLNSLFRDNFERGTADEFKITTNVALGDIDEIELNFRAVGLKDDWYCELVQIVDETRQDKAFVFPVHRWLQRSKSLKFLQYDSHLPQYSKHTEQRKKELAEKFELYEYMEPFPSTPLVVKNLPDEEVFTDVQRNDIAKNILLLLPNQFMIKILSGDRKYSSFEEFEKIFVKIIALKPPKHTIGIWRNDFHFAQQRLSGCNPKLIRLCKELPAKFQVEKTRVEAFLEQKSLDQAMKENKIFIVDLKILEGVTTVDDATICAPIALFHLTNGKLRPLAIQLNQDKGPVFYPDDDADLWTLVKMWFNNADANYHQSISHLGETHFFMESFCVALNRHVSPSHPVFRLLKSHFLNLLAINSAGLKTLINPGGLFDQIMSTGREGALELIAKRQENNFRVNVEGDFKADLEERGLLDDLIPDYYYRKDGLKLYEAISNYVTNSVNLFYHNDSDLVDDTEVQDWAKALVTAKFDGLGYRGVPGNGKFSTKEELIQVLRIIIFKCSVEHAAVNFNQYEEYAFVPNYPSFLSGSPPTDKTPRTEADLLDILPREPRAMRAVVTMNILSNRSTKELGDFEIQYHYDPQQIANVNKFRAELKKISEEIKLELPNRSQHYDILDPEIVPNSISI